MTAKGKAALLEPVAHTVRWDGDQWAKMQAEIRRLMTEEHRDYTTAGYIREVMRVHLASVPSQRLKVI